MILKKSNSRNTLMTLLISMVLSAIGSGLAHAQYKQPTLPPPPPVLDNTTDKDQKGSPKMRYGVHPTVPGNLTMISSRHSFSLPRNITTSPCVSR